MTTAAQKRFPATWCREQFPALARAFGGRPAVYLDGPAGSQVPQRVIDAVGRYLAETNANHGGRFPTSRESDAMLDEAHRAAADLFGAAAPEETIFGANMTSLTFAFSRALARTWKPGDEIIVITWLHRAERDVLQVHPRGDPANPLTGVFLTRSPDRPNPLGLHRARVLAVTMARRSRFSPEWPTLQEAGVKEVDASNWTALFAPKATPQPIIDRLNAELVRILAMPDVKERFAAGGVDTIPSSAAALQERVRQEAERFKVIVEKASIRPD